MSIIQVKEVVEIPLNKLVIGKGQVRLSGVGKEIDELAESIAKIGLLEPIVVCPAEKEGHFEILTGQRRFLAHRQLGRETILAGVLSEKVDETTAKVISVTENLVRRDLDSKDLITVCTSLFKKYGSIAAVCEETGLPRQKVSKYVKYTRLKAEMKKLVDEEGIDLKVALRAQDAASASGEYKSDDAVKLAKEMAGMTGAMQAKVVDSVTSTPERSVDDVIEDAKTGEQITSMVITIGDNLKGAINSYANDEGTKPDDAVRSLLEEGLSTKGYIEENS